MGEQGTQPQPVTWACSFHPPRVIIAAAPRVLGRTGGIRLVLLMKKLVQRRSVTGGRGAAFKSPNLAFCPPLPSSRDLVLPFQPTRKPCWPRPPSCSPCSTRPRCYCGSRRRVGLPSPPDTVLRPGPRGSPLGSGPPACHLPPLYQPHPCPLPQLGCWPPWWLPLCLVPPSWGRLDLPHNYRR